MIVDKDKDKQVTHRERVALPLARLLHAAALASLAASISLHAAPGRCHMRVTPMAPACWKSPFKVRPLLAIEVYTVVLAVCGWRAAAALWNMAGDGWATVDGFAEKVRALMIHVYTRLSGRR